MTFGEDPGGGVPLPKTIFTRITEVTARQPRCSKVFLGATEWAELGALMDHWGAKWTGASPAYDPAKHEETRARFRDLKIYRVDAETFLAAL